MGADRCEAGERDLLVDLDQIAFESGTAGDVGGHEQAKDDRGGDQQKRHDPSRA
jgi:hypothetical protein